MTKYLLVDTANCFFRAKNVSRRGSIEDRLGMSMHITLSSVMKAWNLFQADHVVFCFSKSINELDNSTFQNILNNFFDTCSVLIKNLIQYQQEGNPNVDDQEQKALKGQDSSEWIKA